MGGLVFLAEAPQEDIQLFPADSLVGEEEARCERELAPAPRAPVSVLYGADFRGGTPRTYYAGSKQNPVYGGLDGLC